MLAANKKFCYPWPDVQWCSSFGSVKHNTSPYINRTTMKRNMIDKRPKEKENSVT